jgi:hypothetical protein
MYEAWRPEPVLAFCSRRSGMRVLRRDMSPS